MKFNNPFRTPSADEIAVQELEEAKRDLLEAQSRVEWSTRMMQYQQDRVLRLTNYVFSIGAQK